MIRELKNGSPALQADKRGKHIPVGRNSICTGIEHAVGPGHENMCLHPDHKAQDGGRGVMAPVDLSCANQSFLASSRPCALSHFCFWNLKEINKYNLIRNPGEMMSRVRGLNQ